MKQMQEESARSEEAADQQQPETGDQPKRTSRRNALGVLAAGIVVAACGDSKDLTADRVAPPTTGAAGANGSTGAASFTNTPTVIQVDLATEPLFETGSDLGRAVLPKPNGSGGATAAVGDDPTSPAPAADAGTDAGADPAASATPGAEAAAPAETTVTTASPTTRPSDPSTSTSTSTSTAAKQGGQNEILVVTDETAAPATAAPATAAPTTAAPATAAPATAPTTAAPATTAPAALTTAAPATPATAAPSAPPAAPGVLTAAMAVAKLTFGPTPGQIAAVEAMGPKAFIEDQLRRTVPDGTVEQQVKAIEPIHMSPAELRSNRVRNWWMHNYVGHIGVYRAARSQNQLFEMMGQLWMDHFNVYLDDNFQFFIPDYQENVIRRHAMGSFKDLFRAVAEAPAMLHYLNNDVNDASTPETINENYGRELLELHSLGIDENNRQVYNESDVETAAMIMAGWSAELNQNDPNFGRFRYRPEYEYQGGDRTLLNGAWSSAGLTGKARGDSMLEFLATHPSTARHIAFKICRRFVSDRPSATLVASTAQVFLANDTAIVPVLRHVFNSDEFARSGGQKIRRPLEFQAALLRATSTTFSPVGEHMTWRRLGGYYLQPARHEPWQWELPDGYPDEAEEWIVADAFIARWNHAIQVAEGRVGETVTDLEPLLKAAGGATIGEAAQGIATQLGIGPLPDDVIAANVAGIGYEPDRPIAEVERRRFGTLTGLLISHPLFQTR